MSLTLPELGYSSDALQPHIDARTMEIHHGKHHAGYVSKANDALKGTPFEAESDPAVICANLDKFDDARRTAVRNNAGGHFNHSLFWKVMTPRGADAPTGDLAEAIQRDFGSFDDFKSAFASAAATRFGSGWAWLVVNDGKLSVCSTPNQDNPLMGDAIAGCSGTPILGIDVWEHAYYLNYQNRRPDYVSAWWNVVNWSIVHESFGSNG